ncbi:flagellar biosynthetic protein FliO [Ammoniphilus sp. YIM 78166]|uniref:flagellar biosynthetic protein FliO n=1 Tax=Ammoniphilus sp. YIM 78166 TaxID=1644106 RepID=UPI0010700D15|nr:flagellar biosynthetic protein FliO [Ammoniphilus sp. YIM 78166]
MIMSRLSLIYLALILISLFFGGAQFQLAFADSEQPMVDQGIGKEVNQDQLGNVGADFEILPYLIKVVFFLIIIGVLIYLLIRFLSNQSRQSLGGLPLRIVGGVALGQNRSLQVVQIGRKLYVVGVGQDVRMLTEIEDQVEIETWLTKETETPKMIDLLMRWKKQKSEEQSFQYIFEDQLSQLKENRSRAEQVLYQATETKEGRKHEG